MTRKQQGLIATTTAPAIVLMALLLSRLGNKQLVFGLGTDFFTGVLIGFAIMLTITGIAKLLTATDDQS